MVNLVELIIYSLSLSVSTYIHVDIFLTFFLLCSSKYAGIYISNPKSIKPEIYCEYFVPHFLYLNFFLYIYIYPCAFCSFPCDIVWFKLVWSTGQTTGFFLIFFFVLQCYWFIVICTHMIFYFFLTILHVFGYYIFDEILVYTFIFLSHLWFYFYLFFGSHVLFSLCCCVFIVFNF
jgi:hypothetical protein